MIASHRRAGVSAYLLTTALVLAACGAEEARSGGSTADASAAMLEARTDPGLGTGQSVPLANGGASSSRGRPLRAPAPDQPVDVAALGYDVGAQDAPIQIVEFSDFGCGYCGKFHREIFPVLEREYVATGKVQWKYVPMILGIFSNAEEAARAGECAGEQGHFADMRDRLFGTQGEWKNADDPAAHFVDYAEELRLDVARYQRCVDEGWRDPRIVAGTRLSQQVGVRGTPTFFIVGYAPIPGMLPLDLFRQVLDTVYVERTR